jgi:hypothetical protein
MRTSNKTIMVVLGVGAVLALAGQALAQSGSYRGRDGFRGGSYGRDGSRGSFDGRSPFVNRGYSGGYGESNRHFTPPRIVDSPRDYHRGGFDGRASYGHRGFTGGFSVGYVESPRYYAAPRIIVAPPVVSPWWLGYGSTVYVAPPCGLTGRVFVAPQCSVRRPVFVPSFYPQHRYQQPTWRHDWR